MIDLVTRFVSSQLASCRFCSELVASHRIKSLIDLESVSSRFASGQLVSNRVVSVHLLPKRL